VPDTVPDTVTEYGPVFVELQERVAVTGEGGSVTLRGEIPAAQVKPGGKVELDRATVPAKPPRAVTVIVDIADSPTSTPAGEDAVISKS
jgi:hypothetical protein